MKDIKDVLNEYEETPSSDVWNRLNAQLDKEMPIAGDMSQIRRAKTWKWTAAILSVLLLGGALTVGILLHNRVNQDVIVENTTESIEKQEVDALESAPEQEETVEQEAIPAPETPAKPSPTRSVGEDAPEKPDVQPRRQEETVATRTNSRQIVLPPNSTLAKQLAADPVLKNLSDESVDWSLPVHLSIPNLFTPNNDGVNDYFVIEGLENYSSSRLVIRDKNNKVVYQSDTYKNTWNGGTCPDGVYNYEFTFSYNGIENQATGKVRIMRN